MDRELVNSGKYVRICNVVAASEHGLPVQLGLERLAEFIDVNPDSSYEECLKVLGQCDQVNSVV